MRNYKSGLNITSLATWGGLDKDVTFLKNQQYGAIGMTPKILFTT